MNMGRRIADRLGELGWKQRDLLDRVPDLTPQALSNLITRDSKRSEWDLAIAHALGCSVLWIVYGDPPSYGKSASILSMPESDIAEVARLMRTMSADGRRSMLRMAKAMAIDHEEPSKANGAQ